MIASPIPATQALRPDLVCCARATQGSLTHSRLDLDRCPCLSVRAAGDDGGRGACQRHDAAGVHATGQRRAPPPEANASRRDSCCSSSAGALADCFTAPVARVAHPSHSPLTPARYPPVPSPTLCLHHPPLPSVCVPHQMCLQATIFHAFAAFLCAACCQRYEGALATRSLTAA